MTPIGTDEELIEQLRFYQTVPRLSLSCRQTCKEAADALQSRIAEVERLTEALELFTGQAVFDPHTHRVSVDEFVVSKARAALSQHRTRDE